MTEWTEEALKELIIRDEIEKKDSFYYNAFKQLSQLLEDSNIDTNSVDLTGDRSIGALTGAGDSNISGTSGYRKAEDAKTANKEKLIDQINNLHLQNTTLDGKLAQSSKQNRHQEREIANLKSRIHNLTLEISEKNKAIETINDELLSCNIQNNVLNDHVKELTQENENLVTRWMERVKQDAEKINDANELIESLQKR